MSDIIETKTIVFQYPEISKLISIVVCVYNSEKYLKRMLDAIYAQTYKIIEVIVAYDTKTSDNSLGILKEYAEKYGLIIDSGNDSSIGFSRVRGARLARGEFLIYLDSDDVIVPSYLDDLLGCFNQFPKMNAVYCGFKIANESNLEKKYQKSIESTNKYSIIETKKAISQYYRNLNKSHFSIMGSTWAWLVRRRFIQEIKCFIPNISMREDNVYVLQLLLNSKTIGHSSRCGYIYIKHKTSACNKLKNPNELLIEFKQLYKFVTPLLVSANYEDIAVREKNEDFHFLQRCIVFAVQTLPYSDFKFYLKKEKIRYLSLKGGILARINCLCFNISKRLYWKINHILFPVYKTRMMGREEDEYKYP